MMVASDRRRLVRKLGLLIASLLVYSCSSPQQPQTLDSSVRIQDMTSRQIGELLELGYTTAIFALGSTEQHGPHMTTSADVIHGEEVVRRVAAVLPRTMIGPTVPIGFSENHRGFAGTITLSEATFKSLISDYCSSLIEQGFEEIILIASHGGNRRPASEAVDALREEFGDIRFIVSPDSPESFMALRQEMANRSSLDPERIGAHAGGGETSMILSLAPHHVAMEEAEVGFIGDLSSVRELADREGWKAVVQNGVVGDPTSATPELGAAYLDAWVQMTIEEIEAARRFDGH